MGILGRAFLVVVLVLGTLTGTRPADAILFSGVNASGSFHPTLQFSFGDSITAGYYATGFIGYTDLLATALGTALTGVGQVGGAACDNAVSTNSHAVFISATGASTTPSLTNSTLYTYAYGTNDANNFGAGSHEAIFDLCQLSSISWLAVPSTSKVLAQAVTTSGTWTNDTVPATGNGRTSTVNGSTLTFPITTTGEPLYIWYGVTDGGSGTWTYNIDGAGAVSVNSFTSPATGSTTPILLKRITGVSAGAHSVVIAVTSSGQAVQIWAIGSPPSTPYSGSMRTCVNQVIRQSGDGKAVDTLAYTNDVAAEVALLQGDNLPVILALSRNYMALTSDFADSLHPNDAGHGHIKDAFLGVCS